MEELSELARGKEAEKLTGPTGPSVLISNKSAANIIKNIFVVLY
jgi:hypothetical protein